MNEITYLKTPITVDIGEWMFKNAGLVAVAKKTTDRRRASIFAMQKAEVASKELKALATKDDIILVGALGGDVNEID